MIVKLYSKDQNGAQTYYIEFSPKEILMISNDEISQVNNTPVDAEPCLWGGDVVGAIDNARLSGNVSMDIDPALILMLYADMRNLYQPD